MSDFEFIDDDQAVFMVGQYSSQSTSCSEDEKSSDDEDYLDVSDDDDDDRRVIVGVCAMAKKSNSRPMQEILERLARFKHIQTLVFDEKVILNDPVEKWPACDCLISFHSKGFPLDKAVQYVELFKPYLINDLMMQYQLQNRYRVYQILTEHGIEKPRSAILRRDSSENSPFIEADDYIEVDNMVFHKPFVEKPLSAEDHNVYIYFPASAGGGSQRLFRKIGCRSSVYSPVSTVRKVGSYVYEDFMPTDGTDVKVYTVGPDYAHAEARKSPALDGKVERDRDGKEIRYPVLLSAKEKLIARTVCLAFKQNVCGFDLLRANGKSYVCDVNGFSFVKTSPKYYDDCAKILGNMILRQLAPTLRIPYSITYQPEDIVIVPTTYGTMMELRCVVAVIRHGDRTPKQKMKMEVRHKKFFDLFEKYGGYQAGHLKLKRPKQLQEVLDIARFLLAEVSSHQDPEIEEKQSKLEQLKAVLEMYGHFSGINRKVQFKYQPKGAQKKCSSDEDEPNTNCIGPSSSSGSSSMTESSASSSSNSAREPSLVLILKWGGELTPAGKIQAEELGKAFRCMYPGGQVSLLLIPPLAGDYGQSPGLGLLRLHSTFRHDLKIYASDEGRVQMTAAAFAKGFLALEGELTPILVQMVKSANMNGLLDNENESSKYQNIVKEKLQGMMNIDRQFSEEDYDKLNPTASASILKAMEYVGNPHEACRKIYAIMQQLMERITELKNDPKAPEMKLYHSESWELMMRRWGKLIKDFWPKNQLYDISKIPDIYDCIKYDLQHNMKILRFNEAEELHTLAKAMADIVIPQEYGITQEDKLLIGQCICAPLLRKILADFQRNEEEDDTTRLDSRYSEGVSSPHRHVKTRLYFTSESHIHSLLTVLRYGGLCNEKLDEQWSRAMEYVSGVSELNYMTQIVIMLYEDPTKEPQSDERFHVELHFSPGAYCAGQNKEYPAGRGYRPQHGEKKKEEAESVKCAFRDVATCPGNLSRIDFDSDQGNLSSGTTLLNVEPKSRVPAAIPEVGNLSNCTTDASFAAKCDVLEEESVVAEIVELPKKAVDFSEFSPEKPQVCDTNSADSDELKSAAIKLVLNQLPLGEEEKTTPEEEASIIDEVGGAVGISSPSSQFDSSCSTVGSPCHSCLQPFEEEKEPKTSKDAVCRPNSEKAEVRFSTVRVEMTEEESLEAPEKTESVGKSRGSKSFDLSSRRRHQSSGSVEGTAKEASGGETREAARQTSLDDEANGQPMEKTVKEARSRSLETLQKKDQREHHHHRHHHHHHHHKDHCKHSHKRSSFLSLFSGSNIDTMGSQKSLLISTKVINGSTSAPDLTEVESAQMLDGWRVPSIRPLETLHNALTLRQVENFIKDVTEMHCHTPVSSPSVGTPVCVTPRSTVQAPPSTLALPIALGCSSTGSSGGPSSPTMASSNPEEIIRTLRLLIHRSDSDSVAPQAADTDSVGSQPAGGQVPRNDPLSDSQK